MPAAIEDCAGCRLRRSPGLAVDQARVLPAAAPRLAETKRWSAKQFAAVDREQVFSSAIARAIDSALQSRGGDGLHDVPRMRRNHAQPYRLPVFPSTKSAGMVRGGAHCW